VKKEHEMKLETREKEITNTSINTDTVEKKEQLYVDTLLSMFKVTSDNI
jgi:hypothetical protein